MTKDEKVEALINIASCELECTPECSDLAGCNREFVLNASRADGIRYCRLQLLSWFMRDE